MKLINRLSSAPKGHIKIVGKNYKSFYWYNSRSIDGGKPIYISRKNQGLIKALCQKSYDSQLLKRVRNDLKAINTGLVNITGNLDEVYESLPEIKKRYVHPYRLSDSEYTSQWLALPNPGNPSHPENLIHTTLKQEKVRSKSERSIADSLFRNKIPYKYELPLNLKWYGFTSPDFTILDLKTRKLIYWEHFGRMDDSEYANNSTKKITAYSQNGIVINKNLILTFETSECPLDQPVIDNIIKTIIS